MRVEVGAIIELHLDAGFVAPRSTNPRALAQETAQDMRKAPLFHAKVPGLATITVRGLCIAIPSGTQRVRRCPVVHVEVTGNDSNP